MPTITKFLIALLIILVVGRFLSRHVRIIRIDSEELPEDLKRDLEKFREERDKRNDDSDS